MYSVNSPGIVINPQDWVWHRACAVFMVAASDSLCKVEKALMINLEGLPGPSETTGSLVELHIL